MDTRILQIAFISVVSFGTLIALIALLTGGWGEASTSLAGCTISIEIGILTNRCPKVNVGGSSLCDQIGSSQSSECISKYDFEKYCVTAMFIAIIINIVSIVLTILSFIVIRHEKVPLVLAILAIISTLFIFTVVIVYPAKGISTYKDALKGLDSITFSMEYSYYLTIFLLILMIIASIVGCLMARESFSN